jgi:hypothetical protein
LADGRHGYVHIGFLAYASRRGAPGRALAAGERIRPLARDRHLGAASAQEILAQAIVLAAERANHEGHSADEAALATRVLCIARVPELAAAVGIAAALVGAGRAGRRVDDT